MSHRISCFPMVRYKKIGNSLWGTLYKMLFKKFLKFELLEKVKASPTKLRSSNVPTID